MEKCRHSGKICRAEEIARTVDPESADALVSTYCVGGKEKCGQYRKIEDSGIAFGVDIVNLIEAAHDVYLDITKKR